MSHIFPGILEFDPESTEFVVRCGLISLLKTVRIKKGTPRPPNRKCGFLFPFLLSSSFVANDGGLRMMRFANGKGHFLSLFGQRERCLGSDIWATWPSCIK